MKTLKTIATGLSAAMLATTMLVGAANAAPKPNIKVNTPMNAPKVNIIKPIRPNIARPLVRVRVSKDRFEKKAGQDENQADKLPGLGGQQRNRPAVAALVPPKRLPQPRPDFEDRAGDIADMAGADGIGGINPDDLRVATNPHDPDGALGSLLPGDGEDEQQAAAGPTGPFGRLGGSDSMWNDPRGNVEFSELNPVGGNSHGKDAPSVFPGARVDTGSLLDGLVSDGDAPDGGADTPDVSHHVEGNVTVTKRSYADGHVVVTKTETINRQSDGEPIGAVSTGFSTYPNGYLRMEFNQVDNYTTDESRRGQRTHGPITTEWKSNPDYVEGGGYIPVNCGSVECNESRRGKAGLQLSDGMVRALTDPEHSAAGPRNGAAPIVTQQDLLSQYDPDFNGGGAPTPIDKPRIQSD